MMKSILAFSTAVVFLGLAMPAGAQTQTDTSGVHVANKLLKELWSGDIKKQRLGESTFKAWRSRHIVVNPDVQWAYVLNRIEYDKYREAHAAIADLPQAPGNWDVYYTRVWLSLMVGEIDHGLLGLQEIRAAVASDDDIDDATRYKLFTRLGRLYGFTEGPAADRAVPASLLETLEILTDKLDDVDFGNFEDQRQQVTQKYAGLVNEKSTTVAQQVQKQIQDNATQRQQLTVDNQQMDDRLAELVNELLAIRSKANEELSALRQSALPMQGSLRRIDSELGLVESQIGRLYNDIAFVEHLAIHEPDPYLRSNLRQRALTYHRDLDLRQRDRNSLQGDYNAIAAQLDSLYGQIDIVEQQTSGQISIREQESRHLQSQRKRNLRAVAKLNNPRARTGYVRSMNARTSHLPTYDPFPAVELQQKMLKRIR